LVVCRRGKERVEVQCHGGVAAVRSVVDALVAEGCRETAWQDWLRLSAADSMQAAAQFALADALTARTAAILLDQLNGALAAACRATIAAITAENWPLAAELVGQLLDRRDLGLHLTTPWRVVLAGPPNVGKSSLINALAGYERAIVSPVPGTTRDVVTLTTAIDGWPVELADTAGLRTTDDELESAGVQLAEATLAAPTS
jgi:tRNA modification GTPase